MILRSQALERARTLTPPSTKSENYRYTGVKNLKWNLAPATLVESDEVTELPTVFRDDALAELNLAYADKIKKIHITKKHSGSKVMISEVSHSDAVQYSRIIVEIDSDVEVELIDDLSGGRPLLNQVLEITVGERSKVQWVHIQNLTHSSLAFIRTLITQRAGSEVTGIMGSVGGQKSQSRFEFDLAGEGAVLNLYGAARGVMDQHFDHWMTITHSAGRTTSSLRQWNVMGDHARAVFNAKVVIPAHALGCDAYQKNVNLLLSRHAVIDSLPKLEISTDEVKCAHGSSISPVSDDQMYYLKSRGIDHATAESMLVDGFTEPVLAQIQDLELRSKLRMVLIGRMNNGGWDE